MIMCSEARITEQIVLNEYQITGYKCVECFSENRHTGGVLMYIQNNIKHKVILNIAIDKIIWLLAIETWDSEVNGVFCVFYRSPNSEIENSLKLLDNNFDKIVNLNKFNLITGDLNINLNKMSRHANIANNIFVKHNLTMGVNFNTRDNNIDGTLIDVILTNNIENMSCLPLENEQISDHKTIKIQIKMEQNVKYEKINIISWKHYSKDSLIENLRNCNWSTFDGINLESKITLLRENLLKAVMPLTKRVMIKNGIKPKKWFDDEALQKKNLKINAYRCWKANTNDKFLLSEYVKVRNEYNHLLKHKKAQQTHNEIREAGSNQNKMWKCLKTMISNKSTVTSDEIVFNGNPCNDIPEICEKFNKFFVDSITELNAQIPTVNENLNISNQSETVFNLNEIEIDDVINATKLLKKKVNKSEYLNAMVWADATDYIAHLIKCIINEIISTGVFPKIWKTSTITPIPKIRNTRNANEFRPINATEVDEKISEIIIKKQLINYVESNDIITKTQSAYRAKYSCETTMNYLIRDWMEAIDNGNVVLTVFLDLKRAFETVDRERLINKLENYGVLGKESRLFKNYMNDRKQCVKFNGLKSNETCVEIGLPQGTALSVILFILYINDIVNVPKYGKIALHADDTEITIIDKNMNDAIRKMNQDLERIHNWLNINKLLLNISKTKWMLISKNKNQNIPTENVKIAGIIVERVSCIKYLGILIDENLSFDNQVNELVKKSSQKVNLLKRLTNRLTYDTRKTIYHSIIAPNFEYCSTIYNACTKEQISHIQLIQNRAMRTILKCDYLTSREFMLRALNWLSIDQKIKLNTLITIFKIKNGLLPIYLSENINYNRTEHGMNTRNRNDFKLPRISSERAKKNIYYNGLKLFNELPNEIKNEVNIVRFKENCFTYIRDNYPIL